MKPEKLFIYELAGEAEPAGRAMGDGYIGCWNEAEYSYLFFSRDGKKEVEEIIRMDRGLKLAGEVEMRYEDWEPADAYKPFRVPPLDFVPAWNVHCRENANTVKIGPGVVFGAGNHSTTFRCIEFLVSLAGDENIHTVLDLGTGTGILAVTAAFMGAKDITAVDNNNLAVETAEKNAELNNFSGTIKCVTGDASDYMETGADLVTANIVIWKLVEMFMEGRRLAGRYYIVSGIREHELQQFLDAVSKHQLDIRRIKTDNSWCTLLLENRQTAVNSRYRKEK